MRATAAALCLAVLCLGTASPVAVAGGCNDRVVANVAIAAGRFCWAYRGTATIFAGSFGAGERITVQMGGGRTPNASGPGGFFKEGGGAALSFVAPRDGKYRFSFYPCVLWRSQGAVQICAR